MTSDSEAVTTTATLTLWRVFGLSDNFSDRPKPYWTADAAVTSSLTDRIAVMIGDVPDELLTSLRQWRAQIRGQLDMLVGHTVTPEQRLQMYSEDYDKVQLTEFEADPYVAWLTICVKRSTEISSLGNEEFDWGPDVERIVGAMQRFEGEGNLVLDRAVASVIGASEGLNVRHLRFADKRPLLSAPGKASIMIANPQMSIKDSGVIVGRNDGWAVAPVDRIAAAISSIASTAITKNVSKLIGQPMSWLGSAMGEEEDDLRRFTFAFAGLELLVTQVEKNSRSELIKAIEGLDENLPVTDLLWPSTSDDFVWRNLIFRFAVTAAIYSPSTAKADVAAFKPIARARNDMFQGSEQTITREISIACTELLRKYVALVAARLTSASVITSSSPPVSG